jgi:Ca2+-binding EF-hand superfamily protein
MSSKKKEKGVSLFSLVGGYVIPTDEAKLRIVFDAFDTDKSGTIDYREFSQAYREFEAELGIVVSTRDIGRKFQKFDVDSNNQLSWSEFVQFMLERAACE